MRPVIDLQDKMRQETGKAKRAVVVPAVDEALFAKVSELALPGLKEGYGIAQKMERYAHAGSGSEKRGPDACTSRNASLKPKVLDIIESLERRILREMILHENRRIDGRTHTEIRPISSEVGLLAPRPRFSPLQPG